MNQKRLILLIQFPFVPFPNRSDPQVPYTKFYNQLYQDLP